jgi:hypothetical protein
MMASMEKLVLREPRADMTKLLSMLLIGGIEQ